MVSRPGEPPEGGCKLKIAPHRRYETAGGGQHQYGEQEEKVARKEAPSEHDARVRQRRPCEEFPVALAPPVQSEPDRKHRVEAEPVEGAHDPVRDRI